MTGSCVLANWATANPYLNTLNEDLIPAAQSTYIYLFPSLHKSATFKSVIQLKLLISSSNARCLYFLGLKNTYSSIDIVEIVNMGFYSSFPYVRYLYSIWFPLSHATNKCLLLIIHKLTALGIVSKYWSVTLWTSSLVKLRFNSKRSPYSL